MSKALLVIDIQNDYFEGGGFPQWNPGVVLTNTERAIGLAKKQGVPVILVQHVARGPSSFFAPDTPGVEIHERIKALAADAPVVVKSYADSFHQTDLETVLSERKITELLICGMMTQNCVTHTAISKAAEKYKITVLGDCCTTVSEILHKIALGALAVRVSVLDSDQAFR